MRLTISGIGLSWILPPNGFLLSISSLKNSSYLLKLSERFEKCFFGDTTIKHRAQIATLRKSDTSLIDFYVDGCSNIAPNIVSRLILVSNYATCLTGAFKIGDNIIGL